jgi:hypothetical protein
LAPLEWISVAFVEKLVNPKKRGSPSAACAGVALINDSTARTPTAPAAPAMSSLRDLLDDFDALVSSSVGTLAPFYRVAEAAER